MKCKHCNAEIPNDSNFCEFCGEKVKKRMPWWGILLIVLVSLSFIMFGALALFNLFEYISNSSSDNGNSEEIIIEEPMEETTEVVEVEESPAPIEEVSTPVAEEKGKAEVVGPAAKGAAVSDSKQEKSVKQVPAGYVDLGLSVYWKNNNELGYYTYDAAVQSFGSRLPTKEQCEELENKCNWTWAGSSAIVTGPNGNTIVLPASGYHDCNGNMGYVGTYGNYWSFTSSGSKDAWYLVFNFSGMNVPVSERCYGRSVRLVQGK